MNEKHQYIYYEWLVTNLFSWINFWKMQVDKYLVIWLYLLSLRREILKNIDFLN